MALRRQRDIWDMVVIGGGMSGLNAAWQGSQRGLSVALFEERPSFGGQVATVNALDSWPGVEMASGVELATAIVRKLRRENVQFFSESVATIMEMEDHIFRVSADPSVVRARCVVAAAGGRLKTLEVPGEKALRGKGVSQCAHCDGDFFRNEDVVVVGAGDAALQGALVLAELCRAVYVIVRSKARARRAFMDKATGKTNLHFVLDSIVEAVLGTDVVSGVQLRSTLDGKQRELACSGVFPFIGILPNTSMLPANIRRDEEGKVITDNGCQSSIPGIFAVGALRSGYCGELISAAGEAALAATIIAEEVKR